MADGSARKMGKRLRHASFFSGIGGFDLGFEHAGIETVYLCEKKTFCRTILKQHWADVPCGEDINDVKSEEIPEAEVWTGGFPCQDLSLARMGARAGLGGAQSGLFYRFAELVGERLPKAVVLENVHGLLTSHRGRDFAIVLKALDELGYGLAWRVLNSKDFGVPQSRRRVFIVGVLGDASSAGKILFEPERSEGDPEESGRSGKKPASLFQKIVGNPRKGPMTKSMAHCIYAESARHTGTDWSRNYVWYPDGRVRRLTSSEVERVQGFPLGWTLPAGMSNDSPKLESLRYHAVGNSVTPAVARWIGSRIAQVLAPVASTSKASR
ncbi:DNA cytosine methyltransferase [Arenimonas sp.]|uniref:DNA cytosine methyltransferase n=1 Tax=Arenimonas sp. TaxID=1872635 RepID=UPI0035B291CD